MTDTPRPHKRLTVLAQEWLSLYLEPGDWAIDATCGNGHDTAFLAEKVGAHGCVWSFDIQQKALDATQSLLTAKSYIHQVRLCHQSHEQIPDVLPLAAKGRIKAFMFNLGYLPGSEKSIITETATTLRALKHCCDYRDPLRGVGTLILYRGHSGGLEETNAVIEWLRQSHIPHETHPVHLGDALSPILLTLGSSY